MTEFENRSPSANRQGNQMEDQAIIKKVMDSLRNEGVYNTFVKVANYPQKKIKDYIFEQKILNEKMNEVKFTWIYENNHWGSSESASGEGSTLRYTENLRKELPGVIEKFSIKNVFDAPCGDFNWMKHLVRDIDVNYTGGDIVRPMIEGLNAQYKSDKIQFIHIDLTKNPIPKSDMMICRDCLFHLSFEDAKLVLENFVNSGTTYLLTTTHDNSAGLFSNKNISTGDFRLMDLFSYPYNFPPDTLVEIEDWVAPDPRRRMCLWHRDQVIAALGQYKRSQ